MFGKKKAISFSIGIILSCQKFQLTHWANLPGTYACAYSLFVTVQATLEKLKVEDAPPSPIKHKSQGGRELSHWDKVEERTGFSREGLLNILRSPEMTAVASIVLEVVSPASFKS